MRYEGYCDRLEFNYISGWAKNADNTSTINVCIQVNNHAFSIAASSYRKDLAIAGKGNCAFEFTIPAELLNKSKNTIRVLYEDIQTPLPYGEKEFINGIPADEYYKKNSLLPNCEPCIFEEAQLIYMKSPKTACTTIIKTIWDVCYRKGITKTPVTSDLNVHHSLYKPYHSDLRITHNKYYRAITSIRNPFTRALSCYLDKVVNGDSLWVNKYGSKTPTFKEYLTTILAEPFNQMDEHWIPQTLLIQPKRIRYEGVIAFENLDTDIIKVLEPALGLDTILHTGNQHKTDANKNIEKYYGEEEIKLVKNIYQMDFTNLGYNTNIDKALAKPAGSVLTEFGSNINDVILKLKIDDKLNQLIKK